MTRRRSSRRPVIFFFVACVNLLIAGAAPLPAQTPPEKPFFFYDSPDQKIPAAMLENPLFYDAAAAPAKEGLWIAWLELMPGKGDVLWIGLRDPTGWIYKAQLPGPPTDYANPTPTVDGHGQVWLSYETVKDGDWSIFAQRWSTNGAGDPPLRVNSLAGAHINHRVAVDPTGGLWIVWQGDNQGQFDVMARHISESGASPPWLVSESPYGDWSPSVTVSSGGSVHVVWDGYDGQSYNIMARSFDGKEWGKIVTVADGPAFQAHAQIAADSHGHNWVVWEEDGENWGQEYRVRTPGDTASTKLSDKIGPLHRFRKLHLEELDAGCLNSLRRVELPMPSLKLAVERTNAPPDVKLTGAFYEGGQIAFDKQDRLWIAYRHFYTPWVGIVPEHHKQDSWILFARCLLTNGWSGLYGFSIGQGDALQRFSIYPGEKGIAAIWTTGRTDRRKTDKPRGVALARVSLASDASTIPAAIIAERRALPEWRGKSKPNRLRPSVELAGKKYELFFGDLHRHTDISLCFAPSDGSIDDAYRYAIDAAPLDFLGITDHTHDLAMGDPLSLIWWRSRKEVYRHDLGPAFIPFYAYERSRADTDHNVISLRGDMLRPHTYPLTQFWQELDTNTFTIAHQPFNRILWNYRDDVHRPLVEIYQGFRNDAKEKDAKEGLVRGHKFGIIASSDHLSTDASFACVWSGAATREAVFRSMQARRTYGATAKIQLKLFCGDHWMGESFATNSPAPFQIEALGTAPIVKIDVLMDGVVVKTFEQNSPDVKLTYEPEKSLTGQHFFHVKLTQADGNRAWSSPIWVEIKS